MESAVLHAGADAAPEWPITVIMNGGSGHGDAQARQQQIEAALAEAGREFRILLAREPGGIERLARDAVAESARRPQIIVAAGGDGTINTVADAVGDAGLPLGVIPLGTFNYFARDLGIPLDPSKAVRALLDGRVRRVPIARVNGRLFLINASIGLYRRVQEEREQVKRRFGRYRFMAVLSALVTLWQHHRTYHVELELDGRPVALRTLMIFFGLNTLQLEKLDLDVARCSERGMLALLILRPMSRLKLLGFALRGALQGLDDPKNLLFHCSSTVRVHWRGARRIKVAIDGEAIECDLPLNFQVFPGALPVIVPREPEPRK